MIAFSVVQGSVEAWLRAGAELLGVRPQDAVADGNTAWVERGNPDALTSFPCLSLTEKARPSGARPLSPAFPIQMLEHTADEGFVAHAPSRLDVFAAAAEALGAIMVNPDSVHPVETRVLSVDNEGPDDERMFAWLSEVLFHMDAHRFAIRRVAVVRDDGKILEGVLFGEPLDETRHDIHGAIKAMTYHALEVGPIDDGTWRAQVVVDV